MGGKMISTGKCIRYKIRHERPHCIQTDISYRFKFVTLPLLSQAYHSPNLLQQYQLTQTADLTDQVT